MMHIRWILFVLCVTQIWGADPPTRVGLDTQKVEWELSLPKGGPLCRRNGKPLMTLAPGEKIRVWWDARGAADPTEEYRVQVGPPLDLQAAEAILERLRAVGEAPERQRVADGGTWRVLTGRFPTAEAAEPLLAKLGASGFAELWVSSESRPGKPRKGRALYAVTERYERRPLPQDGIRCGSGGDTVVLHGKGTYRGVMEIFPNAQGRLTVVNTLPLESYLRGVVPREMGPAEFPSLEAIKAQAVAARTYAYVNRGKRAAEGFDLLDTVADQVYGGIEGETAMSDQAVLETAGLIATFRGKPIQALFMANGGGATLDNTFVFGGDQGYLKGVTSYAARPMTLPFQGMHQPAGAQGWLSWELLKLAACELIPVAWLDGVTLQQSLTPDDVALALGRLCARLGQKAPSRGPEQGTELLLHMAKALGFQPIPDGMERPQDADYFLGAAPVAPGDRLLAAFLTRRAIVPAPWWLEAAPTKLQGLSVLAKLWLELETLDIPEGRLLRDGSVQVKGKAPIKLHLAPQVMLAEEVPGGSLRLVKESAIQVGDKVRWLPTPEGSPLLVRRLDPDGASWDRYNPTAHWRVEIKESELRARLAARAGFSAIRELKATHNDQGRVTHLAITDEQGKVHAFTGMRIRGILGLKDNVFRFIELGKRPERRWICYGRGWGHGVGMDQTGAFGMALEGATFEDILKHYYAGISLTKLGE